jgi:putative heme transporter
MVEHAPSARRGQPRARQIIQGLVSLALVAVIFYKLFKGIDFGEVGAAVTSMTWLELIILGLLAIWNLATYAFVWMAVTPGLSFRHGFMLTQSATAVANTVPGGSAIGIGMT